MNKNIKVLQVNKLYWPHVGGIEKVVQEIADFLKIKSVIQSDILVCQSKGPRIIENINGSKVYRSSSLGMFLSLPISFDFFFLFNKIFRKYDLIIFHHPFPLFSLARLFFIKKGQKTICWYHSDIVRQKFLKFFINPIVYWDLKRVDMIIVSSKRIINSSKILKRLYDKCYVIPFGVDSSKYLKDHSKEVDDIKRKYGRFFLAVGRLVYYKGYFNLIEAMKTTPGKLIIIGNGPLKDSLNKLILNYKLNDRVFIISDYQEDLIPYYKACDFFVFPSIANSEAFGLVQIEAMMCGKPVINTNLPTGVPEVSLNGETGITVPVNDIKALSSAIKKLWEEEDLRLSMGIKAKERANNLFSLNAFKDNFLKALSFLFEEIE